ncbi:MAG: hypothetical protein A2V70_07450, partial [Planctomycetes bacterium RBG_13_63_9]
LLVAAAALWQQGGAPCYAGPIALDGFAYYTRWLALALGALLVLLALRPVSGSGAHECVGLILVIAAGLMLVGVAGGLVLIVVGLELISIATFVVLWRGHRDRASQEATAKYIFPSVLASAMVLCGLSFLYGASGSIRWATMSDRLAELQGSSAGFASLAVVLVSAGLGFRIAVVPFHFYAPDVFQETTHANAALLSAVPKAAGLVVLARITMAVASHVGEHAWQIALVLAVLTMTLGNVMALWQDNLRRLLAYCSIAHGGYLLIGLAAVLAPGRATGEVGPVAALLFHLGVYGLAIIGAFAVLEGLGRRGAPVESVVELAGLARTHPMAAALISVFMFSLAGLPPLAGFWGKLVLLGSAPGIREVASGAEASGAEVWPWLLGLGALGVVNVVVAAAYHVRIVGVMYFRTPLGVPKAEGGRGTWLAATLCGVLTILIGLWPGPLLRESVAAGRDKSAIARSSGASAAGGESGRKCRHPSLPRGLAWRRTYLGCSLMLYRTGVTAWCHRETRL